MNPITRIGIETAVLIIVLVVLVMLVSYLLGAFL
jgi:hypothetical protein